MGQYWLGKAKPKQASKMLSKSFHKNISILFTGIFNLQTSETRQRLRLPGLDFPLFNVISAREVPFGMSQYIYILHGPISALLYVPFILVDSKIPIWWWNMLANVSHLCFPRGYFDRFAAVLRVEFY